MSKKVNNENVINYYKKHWMKQHEENEKLRDALKSVLDQFVPEENFSSIEAKMIATEARKLVDNSGRKVD